MAVPAMQRPRQRARPMPMLGTRRRPLRGRRPRPAGDEAAELPTAMARPCAAVANDDRAPTLPTTPPDCEELLSEDDAPMLKAEPDLNPALMITLVAMTAPSMPMVALKPVHVSVSNSQYERLEDIPTVNVAFDTMAAVSLVSQRFRDGLQLTANRIRVQDTEMRGVGEQVVRSTEQVLLDLHFPSWTAYAWCAVVPEIANQIGVLLGFSWLCKHRAIIEHDTDPDHDSNIVNIDLYLPRCGDATLDRAVTQKRWQTKEVLLNIRTALPSTVVKVSEDVTEPTPDPTVTIPPVAPWTSTAALRGTSSVLRSLTHDTAMTPAVLATLIPLEAVTPSSVGHQHLGGVIDTAQLHQPQRHAEGPHPEGPRPQAHNYHGVLVTGRTIDTSST